MEPCTPKVPITCPELDELRRLVGALPDAACRSRARALIEIVRQRNQQLRANARTWRMHAREVCRLDFDDGAETTAEVD